MAQQNNQIHTCIKTDVFEQIKSTLTKIEESLSENFVTRKEFELQKTLWQKEKELAEEKASKKIQQLEADLRLAVAQRDKDIATLRLEQIQNHTENQKDISMIKWVWISTISIILVAVIGKMLKLINL